MRTITIQLFRIAFAAGLLLPPQSTRADADAAPSFFAPPREVVAATSTNLVYPKGAIFPFWGYSGTVAREATNHFTMIGPHYGDFSRQLEILHLATEAGLPYLARIGVENGGFTEPGFTFELPAVAALVSNQVNQLKDNPHIGWWMISPEEARPWRSKEMDYLRTVTRVIRELDGDRHPIMMYEANNRTADSLATTGEYLDFVSKGAYVQASGYQDDRVWVRWSMAQETQACKILPAKDGRPRVPLFIPQLSTDPTNEAGFKAINTWVRHDCYCALIHGAKGIGIWSLFKRASVKESYDEWYSAYAGVAKDLNGVRRLGDVFLFGEDRSDLNLIQTAGLKTVSLWTGPRGALAGTHVPDENRARFAFTYPALSIRNLAFRGQRYVFVCNSSREECAFTLAGWPETAKVEDAFTGAPIATDRNAAHLKLPPWGVMGIAILPVRDAK